MPEASAREWPRLAKRFATRERGRLERLAGGKPESAEHKATTELLIHLAAYATLCGEVTQEEARSAAEVEADVLGLKIYGGPSVLVGTLGLRRRRRANRRDRTRRHRRGFRPVDPPRSRPRSRREALDQDPAFREELAALLNTTTVNTSTTVTQQAKAGDNSTIVQITGSGTNINIR